MPSVVGGDGPGCQAFGGRIAPGPAALIHARDGWDYSMLAFGDEKLEIPGASRMRLASGLLDKRSWNGSRSLCYARFCIETSYPDVLPAGFVKDLLANPSIEAMYDRSIEETAEPKTAATNEALTRNPRFLCSNWLISDPE